jgi:2,3-diketo-5-methylthiopentyl-1-phosphate enolase
MTIEVDYLFPPEIDPEKQAKIIAIAQTAGTWDERFAHRQGALEAHLGSIVAVNSSVTGNLATVAFPLENVENDIPSLLTVIFGKYSMAGAAKVAAIRLPEDYGLRPKFGIDGIRKLVGSHDRPLVMAIFKPALGLSPNDYARILSEVADAGLDIIKDDEIVPDRGMAPTRDRLSACLPILDQVRERSGRELLYCVNITGRADLLLEKARYLVKSGTNALLFNVLTYGWSLLEALASDPEINVPIFAHPALAGALCAAPYHGFDYAAVLGTLMARAGADAVLYPAHYGSLPFAADREAAIRDILRSRNVFPVPSAGINPTVVPQVVADYGKDVILNAGTGIMDFPGGAAAGVKAFFTALAAVGF